MAILDRAICSLLFLLVLLTPLPFGSVNALPVLLIEGAALLLFFLWIIQLQQRAKREPTAQFQKIGMERIALVFIAVALIQLVPLPSPFTAWLFPATHAIYQGAAEAVPRTLSFHPLSLNSFAGSSGLLLFVALFLIYVTAANHLHGRNRRILIYAIILSAIFQSLYGIYELYSGNPHIFGFEKLYMRNVATGTFINRNHFVLCVEMALPFTIAMICKKPGTVKILALCVLLASMVTGIILSNSRSGILFSGISVTVFFLLYWNTKGMLCKRILFLIAAFTVAAMLILTSSAGKSFLTLADEWTLEGSRGTVWRDSIAMFSRFPIAGTGLGTFEQAFPMFDSSPDQTPYDHAHNDFLELLVEVGGGILILYAAGIVVFLKRLRTLLSQPAEPSFTFRLAAFCSLLSFCLHGLVDFPVHIPALAVLGSVVAGMALNHENI